MRQSILVRDLGSCTTSGRGGRADSDACGVSCSYSQCPDKQRRFRPINSHVQCWCKLSLCAAAWYVVCCALLVCHICCLLLPHLCIMLKIVLLLTVVLCLGMSCWTDCCLLMHRASFSRLYCTFAPSYAAQTLVSPFQRLLWSL